MAIQLNKLALPLNGTGTEIPALNIEDVYNVYVFIGTATAIGNYAIVPTGTPVYGTSFNFQYEATLDITTNGTTFTLFGTTITQAQLLKTWYAVCFYDGSAWKVQLLMNFSESQMVSTDNLTDLSVTTAKINTLAVTTPKIDTSAVTTIKLADNSVTTAKIVDANVTTSKIADLNVTTAKLAANSVTNAKLAQMPNLTIKGNTSGATADPQDLSLISPSGIGSYFWNTTGNAGTTAGTHFVGTTDAIDLVFKVNNSECGRINLTDFCTSFGLGSSLLNSTGTSNVAFGYGALTFNTSGSENTAIGRDALVNLTTGSNNVSIGNNSADALTTGSNNTIVGDAAAPNSVNSLNRIALGKDALATADYQFAIPDNVTTVKFTNSTITSEGLAITSKSINTTAGDSATINAVAGRFRKDTSGTTFTLTNSYITANSIVMLQIATVGLTAGNNVVAVAGAGSAVITFQSAAGVAEAPNANADVNFWVIN